MKQILTVLIATLHVILMSCKNKVIEKQTIGMEDSITVNVSKPYVLEGTETHRITSSINKKEYDLFIQLPPSYYDHPNQLFPVLFLTDADYAFPLVSSISSRLFHTDLIEQFIVVGVSFSIGDDKGVSKTRDYTPTFSPNEKQGFSKESKMASGHANKFATFLKEDVLPFVAKKYRMDYDHKVLAGHSFGGLFTSYVAISQADVFDAYLIGSPSLWYHNFSMFDIEKSYAEQNKDLKARLFFCIGSQEDAKNFHPMVTQMLDFEKRLKSRGYPNLETKSVVIPDEGHYTVYPSFITKGIIWAFKKNTI
jgi:predicted alpha/beta superfamily hydrolase